VASHLERQVDLWDQVECLWDQDLEDPEGLEGLQWIHDLVTRTDKVPHHSNRQWEEWEEIISNNRTQCSKTKDKGESKYPVMKLQRFDFLVSANWTVNNFFSFDSNVFYDSATKLAFLECSHGPHFCYFGSLNLNTTQILSRPSQDVCVVCCANTNNFPSSVRLH
jgi:hypothetical protein